MFFHLVWWNGKISPFHVLLAMESSINKRTAYWQLYLHLNTYLRSAIIRSLFPLSATLNYIRWQIVVCGARVLSLKGDPHQTRTNVSRNQSKQEVYSKDGSKLSRG